MALKVTPNFLGHSYTNLVTTTISVTHTIFPSTPSGAEVMFGSKLEEIEEGLSFWLRVPINRL